MAYQDVGLIYATIDSRIRIELVQLPKGMASALKNACSHANPRYHKNRNMGLATWGVSSKINTWIEDDGVLSLPRGATRKVRELAAEHGHTIKWIDKRVEFSPIAWPKQNIVLRDYQDASGIACKTKQQGIVRAPTGSGKTTIALAVAAMLEQPTLVIMRNKALLRQWMERAVSQAGLKSREIGELRGGGKHRIGSRLTLALQQTLYSGKFPLESVAHEFGTVIVDEVHETAAVTFQKVIDVFPAKYRLGFSADETRKDKMEFLVYDQMGAVIHEVFRDDLENEGTIVPVNVRMIPTDFEADWYRDAQGNDRNFNRLLEELTTDEARNEQILDVLRDVALRESPVMVFSHRVEHARWIADVGAFSRKVTCGLMLGGPQNETRFNEDLERLKRVELMACAGTYQAIGTGIDAPNVRAGLMTTPIGNNRQFFGQVRGRICRSAPGKTHGTMYVAWDRNVFPEAPARFAGWNDGRVEIWDASLEVWKPYKRSR
jgi:superfamily II DNA or RNA helicase